MKELLDPLIDYAKRRGQEQVLQMLPWFAALTVSAVNVLAFYATYMGMLAANSDSLRRGIKLSAITSIWEKWRKRTATPKRQAC
jgi:hypothetical protein